MAQRGIQAKIDLGELEKLCVLQPTDEEVAAFFGVSARTILRRKKNQKFAEAMERGKARGRMSIRRAQMRMLEQGNATMGVWLGKQYLGQNDYPLAGGPGIHITIAAGGVTGGPVPKALDAPEKESPIIDIGP